MKLSGLNYKMVSGGKIRNIGWRKKRSKNQMGNKNSNFKGFTIKRGYKFIYCPHHPYSNTKKYVREHRLVMEKYLGRYLEPYEVVHHINMVRDDNNINNLILFSNTGEHTGFHRRFL